MKHVQNNIQVLLRGNYVLKLSMQTNTFEHSLAITNKKRKHVKARLGFAEKSIIVTQLRCGKRRCG